MRAFVSIRSAAGQHELGHGDIIGRLRSAALHLDDPRISEAHAMVSVRGDALKLMALRGRVFEVDVEAGTAREANDITLRDGLDLGLGPDVILHVEEVFVPETVLAIEGPGVLRYPLQAVMSLYLLPIPRILPGFHGDAPAVIWGEGGSWRLRKQGARAEILEAGSSFALGDLTFSVVEMPTAQSGVGGTVYPDQPLRIVVSYDTAEIHAGERVTLLSGVQARILTELVAFDGPAPWDVLAGEVWGAGIDRVQLRARFDMAMLRLRKRLREGAVRDELVVSTGTGQVQLLLRAGDVVDARG